LKIHGITCLACGFNFQEVYGGHGEGYIEIHHIYPLAARKNSKSVNPKTDLIPLCSNCHRMVHRKKEVLSVDELKKLIK
jgi:5-methylcytosine-specific restriction protein A